MKLNVLVTGAGGFIGQNLCAQLEQDDTINVIKQNRQTDSESLEQLIISADFIFHLAGINRPESENEFIEGNVDLTREIISLLEKNSKKIQIVFSSSTQSILDNPYGSSKKKAEEILEEWASKNNSEVYIFKLPNVFGKWSKPNYNSVVATFCHNISRDIEVSVDDPSKVISFVYIDDVVTEFIKILKNEKYSNVEREIPRIFNIELGDLAKKIKTFKKMNATLVLPNFIDAFDKFLYATYTSFTGTADLSYPLRTNRDERGSLSEFIKSNEFGQIFISTTNPGYTRGNHWHNTKIEKFLVVSGDAEIKLRSFNSDEIISYKVNGENPTVVDMAAGYIHSITNTSSDQKLVTVFWSNEIFNKDKPDTYFQEV